MLKICSLAYLTIHGPYRFIAPKVRTAVKARTGQKKLSTWRPLGMNDPGPQNWRTLINDQSQWRRHYEWLDARYKYLHDQKTVPTRRLT
jgi:hypothetical protein